MGSRPLFDLYTYVNTNFAFAEVNAAVTGTPLTANPNIRMSGDDDAAPSTDLSNGQIEFNLSTGSPPTNMGSKRHKHKIIEGLIQYFDESSPSSEVVWAIYDQIETVMNENNNSGSRTYDWWFVREEYDGNYAAATIDFMIASREIFKDATS